MTDHLPSTINKVEITLQQSVLQQRKRILFSFFILSIVLLIILILAIYAGKKADESESWDTYIHVIRTIFLEILVLIFFTYIYKRFTSTINTKRDAVNKKKYTQTDIWHGVLIASLIILWIPIFIIVIYPLGRWVPSSATNRLINEEPPVFVHVGFGSGAIMIELLFFLVVADILYHIGKRLEKIWFEKCFRKETVVTSSVDKTNTTTTTPTNIDPEIAIQTNPSELEKWEKEQYTTPVTNTLSSTPSIQPIPKYISIPFGIWKWLKIHLTPHPLPLYLVQIVLLFTLGFSIWGFIAASKPPRIMHVEVPLLRLPASLDGFRIIQLTDVHTGPVIGRSKLQSAVEISNSLYPDIVVITGDLTDASDEIVKPILGPAAYLKSKYNRTYLVTGNHDYYEGNFVEKMNMFNSLGITVLTNTIVQVPENATDSTQTFDLVGVPDWSESKKVGPWVSTDLPGTVQNRNISREMIVLAHQPGHAKEAGLAAAGLQLTGHVHCGQLVPVNIATYIVMPYVRGLYERLIASSDSNTVKSTLQETNTKYQQNQDNWKTLIYMSCGTYGWGPLFRTAAPHEITEVVLRSVDVVGTDFKPIVEPR